MASIGDISKITLPGGDEYDLKVYSDHIAPMVSKTFTGVVGTANTDLDCTFFFGTVRPTSYYGIWKIRYKVSVHITGTASTYNQYAQSYSEVNFFGSENTYQAYHNFNHIHNTSYRPAYYNTLYNLTKAGYDAGLSHALGVGLRYSWNAYAAAYPREITIQILECVNCEFTFLNEMIKWTSLPNFNTTNYQTYRQIDFATNGLQETSDANDVNYQNRIYYSNPALKSYAAGGRYTLTFTKNENYVLPITSTDNKTNGEAKTYTTESFNPFGEIYYRNASGAIAAEGVVGNATLYRQIMVDARYSFTGVLNGATSVMTAGKPVYLVCVPQSDGMVKLHTNPLSFTTPTTEDGLYYILLGYSYNYYQFELLITKNVYQYKNGTLRLITGTAQDALKVNGHTVAKDVPSSAVFTDTTYAVATTAANGLMSSGDKAKVNGLKALASKDNVSTTYKPAGTVSKPSFTGTSATISIPITAAGSVSKPNIDVTPTTVNVSKLSTGGTVPSLTMTVDNNQVLVFSWSAGSMPTFNNQAVVTGISAALHEAPTFTGSSVSGSTTYTPAGSVSQPTFTGTSATLISS